MYLTVCYLVPNYFQGFFTKSAGRTFSSVLASVSENGSISPFIAPHNLWPSRRKANVQPRTDSALLKKSFICSSQKTMVQWGAQGRIDLEGDDYILARSGIDPRFDELWVQRPTTGLFWFTSEYNILAWILVMLYSRPCRMWSLLS